VSGGAILPGATIGIVGGGQLGRMFAVEARRMGYRVVVLDPGEDAPAAQVADAHIRAPLDDHEACMELARRCDLVTLEWENADVAALRRLAERVGVHPSPDVLEIAQHRVLEKDAARRLGVPTAAYRAVRDPGDLARALAEIGAPAILKTARMGYDGKGQLPLDASSDLAAAYRDLAPRGEELILEARIPFRMEVSVVCARNAGGAVACFPVAENEHRGGILHLSVMPARIEPSVAARATELAEAMATGLGVVGLLAVEFFVTADGDVLMNEVAPRPHNSGHQTREACAVSQFEQQLRAVTGLPLADASLLRPAAMVNLLGEDAGTGLDRAGVARAMAVPTVTLHLYGKREARAGRKMGHLAALGATADEAAARALLAWRSAVEG
jgi:5-(carboxyamino)imidazole ribonucleotide synthase